MQIFPTGWIGDWKNPEAVFSQDLGEEANLEEFNQENSTEPPDFDKTDDFSPQQIIIENLIDQTNNNPSVEPAESEINNSEKEPSNEPENLSQPTPEELPPSENLNQLNEPVVTPASEEVPPSSDAPEIVSWWQKIKSFFNFFPVFAQEDDIEITPVIGEQPDTIIPQLPQAEEKNDQQSEEPKPEIPIDEKLNDQPSSDSSSEENLTEEENNLVVEDIFELNNFSVDEEFFEPGKKINNIQLRVSMAGRGGAGDRLVIEDSWQEQWENLGELSLADGFSNQTNGGYFLYGLPVINDPEFFKNFKVRFIYLNLENKDENIQNQVSIDAVWLEVEYEKVIEKEEQIEKIEIKNTKAFSSNQNPEFQLPELNLERSFFDKIKAFFGQNNIKAKLVSPDGQESFAGIIINGEKIKISKKEIRNFKPGIYKLIIHFQEGEKEYQQESTFAWGVLAINTNKSIYLPGEESYLQMAVLNDLGRTICNANLNLKIKNIISGNETILSTSEGTIKYSDSCGPNNVTDHPDYFVYYQVEETGEYQLILTNLDNGYEINDYFSVQENIPFEVERIGATRINPFISSYVMNFKIKANQDFEGDIYEQVPNDFQITPQEGAQIKNIDGVKTIIWQKKISVGEIIDLNYQYQAPQISPQFYLLGPLKIKENDNQIFSEYRQWQIAADVTNMLLFWEGSGGSCSGAGAPPTDWTLVNDGSFTQDFPRGDATYGASEGGSATHDHTATGTSTASSATRTAHQSATGDNNAIYNHTHSVTISSVGTANSLPSYKDLCVIKLSAGGIPSGSSAVPQNTLTIFDATVPSNWTDYSSTFGTYYIRGNTTPGGTGGSNTHANPGHAISGSLSAPGGVLRDTTGIGSLGSLGTHTHTLSVNSTDTPSIEPLSQNVILGKKATSAGPIPAGMIALFDGDPGSAWDIKSDTSDDFATKYIKVTGAYGNNSSGATIHSHSAINTTSGSYTATEVTGAAATGQLITTHTHPVALTVQNGTNKNLPPYTDVIIAKKLPFNISGTSDMTSGIVKVAYDNSLQSNEGTIEGDGNWQIDLTYDPSANQIITVWVSDADEASESTAVTKYDGSGNITGMILNTHVLSIGSADNPSLTVTNLNQYDNDDDEDIMYDANSGGVTGALKIDDDDVYGDEEKIDILANATLTIATGESLSAHDVAINGSLTSSGTGTFNIDGSWDNNNDFNTSGETINFLGTTTETIDSTGASDSDVNKVVLNGGGGQWTLTTALVINDDLTIIAGTLVGTSNLTVSGGDIDCSGTCGSIALTGGTTTLAGTGNIGTTGLSLTWTFYNLTLDGATTSKGTGTITVSSVLTINGSRSLIAGERTWTLTGAGTPFVIGASATFTASTSTFIYNAAGSTNIAATTYNNLTFSPALASSDITYTGLGAIVVGATLDLYPSGTANTLTFGLGGNLTGSSTITIRRNGSDAKSTLDTSSTNNYSITAATISIGGGGRLNANNSNIALTGTSGTLFTRIGTFDAGGSTVIMNPDTSATLTSGTVTFYKLTLSPDINDDRNYTFGADAVVISNDFSINPGRGLTGVTADTLTVTLGAALSISGTTTITSSNAQISSVLDTKSTGNFDLNISNLSIESKGTLLANGSTVNVSGNWTNDGAFTAGTSSVVLNGGSKQTLSGSMIDADSFYDLTLENISGTGTAGCGAIDPGVDFEKPATVTSRYNIITSGVKVEYESGISYTFQDINWDGSSGGDLIYFRAETVDSAWLLNLLGNQAVIFVSTKDSDASGGVEIDATDSSNEDCGNNPNWNFGNTAPNFDSGPAETVTSSSANPTNENDTLAIEATATDNETNDWKLLICKNDSVTGVDCTGGLTSRWCESGYVTSGDSASCTITMSGLSLESYNWYAFACDASICSTPGNIGSGDSGSPFYVNHRPTFSSFSDDAPKNPNEIVTFVSSADDGDTSDTVTLYICKTNSFSGGASPACAGGEWCHSSAGASDPTCQYDDSDNIIQDNAWDSFGFMVDNHGLVASGGSQGSNSVMTINNVAPSIVPSAIDLRNTGNETTLVPSVVEGETLDFLVHFVVTDMNSCLNISAGNEISSALLHVYHIDAPGQNSFCDGDDVNDTDSCYQNAQTGTGGRCFQDVSINSCSGASDSTVGWTCEFPLQYYVDSTVAVSQFPTENWLTSVIATDDDTGNTGLVETDTGREMDKLVAYDLDDTSIAYGSVAPDNESSEKAITLAATGNVGVDAEYSGADMCSDYPTCAGETIDVEQQKYDLNTGQAWADMTYILDATPTERELNCAKTTSSGQANKDTYFKIKIPSGQAPESYTGADVIAGVESEVAGW